MSCEAMYGDAMTQAPEQSTARGWMPDDSTFGARLALVRQHMKWGNVREAAVECGLPPESWRTWERDGVEPRRIVEIASLISNRTGCDYGWLLAGPRLRQGGAPNERSEALTPRPRRDRRTDEPRRGQLVFGSTDQKPQGPFGHSRPGAARPTSGIPASSRRPRAGRPANRATAA